MWVLFSVVGLLDGTDPGDNIVEDLRRDGLLDLTIAEGGGRSAMLEEVVEGVVLLDEVLVAGWQVLLNEWNIILTKHLHIQCAVDCHNGASDLADGRGRVVG